jgi:hypothetical protein
VSRLPYPDREVFSGAQTGSAPPEAYFPGSARWHFSHRTCQMPVR